MLTDARVGPHHESLIGRAAGGVPNLPCCAAMKVTSVPSAKSGTWVVVDASNE